MILHEKLAEAIHQLHQQLREQGALRSKEQLQQYYQTFQTKFGPDALSRLDGEALLSTMHDHGNRDSLVYWLEFKNDDEFPAIFGSIAGGSALKFRIYRRRETGVWMTGSPLHRQELTLDAAVEYARSHREQLIAGVRLLDALPENADDAAYQQLQQDMDTHAPDVSRLAWGHKYFSLYAPTKLDDYHNRNYQRFYLITLLQQPAEEDGRYVDGGRFAAIAREQDLPINHLTTVLNQRNETPYRYWRIGTSFGDEPPGSRWPDLRDGNFVMIGWPDLGDLSEFSYNREAKDAIRTLLSTHYPNHPAVVSRKAGEVIQFATLAAPRDLVMASSGKTVLGIGRITGDYLYEPGSEYAHRLPVEWLHVDPWEIPHPEGLRTTFQMVNAAVNQVQAERYILGAQPIKTAISVQPVSVSGRRRVQLTGIPGRVQQVLARKKQVILYGPPGTGKTYWAEHTACDLAAHQAFGEAFGQLESEQQQEILRGKAAHRGLVRLCAFHPTFGYEDFLEGYRPELHNGQMTFVQRDGIFKQLCQDAQRNADLNFYLIIDEINRGDIPRIFGELLTVLENDKRGKAITLPVSGEAFVVPSNVYLIGTMNTADRSIALLDTALRRRFGFVELMPDIKMLGDAVVESIPLGPWLDALNQRILAYVGRDARNLQIGHAYLLESGTPVNNMRLLARIVQEDILPLLEEYCYEDYIALERILGRNLVDAQAQRIRHELFLPGREGELVQALLEPNPELATSLQAVTAEAEADEVEDRDLENDDNGEI